MQHCIFVKITTKNHALLKHEFTHSVHNLEPIFIRLRYALFGFLDLFQLARQTLILAFQLPHFFP